MFTGIVEQVGRVRRAEERNGILTVTVAPERMWTDLELGESVACSGTCLTVTGWDGESFTADLSQETLKKTAPNWHAGVRLNLERAMTAAGRFGGHVVSGHVDGTGEILELREAPGAYTLRVRAAPHLARYLVPKGSVTVDGVSLTVVDTGGPGGSRTDLAPDEFTLWLVPHTLAVTALGEWREGAGVNLEADQMAKYVERLLLMRDFGWTEVSA
ncbi:riboflavin synthase [Deinococcus metallilatus]|uniref:Riboflavin synthase n=1 Tax=Deinococcus metallilatus TaxID=1211322 RepID=A0AAJ5F4A0_9DEIO|nr:riboflavin synthase [Deinococcus metallilatus]MBB5297103.1 riboflavin synthase [Deinococcus metallilatus]QBY07794.1 riboflavin synthase [Deinococcus metallilatus]RXJ13494.1 riboflavin synthase [Deinococcus metallilatus]TLK22349.1 riboflavin synthase [Deinococcus metallilatus]GMA17356.1 riboflavin synthase subunit alpha [Deinococcus metallilatus]